MGSLRKGFILMISVLGTFFPSFFPPSHLSFFPPITQDTVTEVWWSFVSSYSLISILLCMRHCVRRRGDAQVTQPWRPPSWGSVPLEKYRGAKLCGDVGPPWCWRNRAWTSPHSSSSVPGSQSQCLFCERFGNLRLRPPGFFSLQSFRLPLLIKRSALSASSYQLWFSSKLISLGDDARAG